MAEQESITSQDEEYLPESAPSSPVESINNDNNNSNCNNDTDVTATVTTSVANMATGYRAGNHFAFAIEVSPFLHDACHACKVLFFDDISS